jgi:hypothetical protein
MRGAILCDVCLLVSSLLSTALLLYFFGGAKKIGTTGRLLNFFAAL